MAMRTLCFTALILIAKPKGDGGKDFGWLYTGGEARLVRFRIETDDPTNRKVFFPSPQGSGYIFIKSQAFTLSFAEVWGTSLIEYQNGVLSAKQIVSSQGFPADLSLPIEKHVGLAEAFSTAMGRVACAGLGSVCKELLRNPKVTSSSQTIHSDNVYGGSTDIVFGIGRGALLNFTEVTPVERFGGKKRISCSFDVIIVGKNQ